jgi:trans-2,3-dihydro-3-hydroxyanthranilate isomerase
VTKGDVSFSCLLIVQEFAKSAVKYRYYTCDVFTETRFGGNQLAVLPEAVGLSAQQMQQIAREFNFSETTFVFPARAGHTRHVRIFTPAREIPFAGHPNIGTAFVLASAGELGEIKSSLTVTFEEESGLVSVTIQESGGKVASCELTAPQSLSFGKTLPVEFVAAAISIDPKEIVTKTHGPQVASVGLPFVMVELKDRSVIERARINMSGFEALAAQGVMPDVYLYTRVTDGFDIRARMFAPLSGVPEDPATGSANCALAGLLAHYSQDPNGSFTWRIAQGVEMGRPSTLIARAEKTDGVVQTTRIGGATVLVGEGVIYLD